MSQVSVRYGDKDYKGLDVLYVLFEDGDERYIYLPDKLIVELRWKGENLVEDGVYHG